MSVSGKTTDSVRRSQNTTDKAGRLILPFETGIAVPAATPRRRRPSRSEIQAGIASHHSQRSLSLGASLSLLDVHEIRRISGDLEGFILEVPTHRQQPVKIPAKSPPFWSSLAGRFWSSRSNCALKKNSHCSSTAVGCSSGSCVLIKKRSSFEINLFYEDIDLRIMQEIGHHLCH